MPIKRLAAAAAAIIGVSLALATGAQAASFWGGDYPRFTYEGSYPTQTPCSGAYQLLQSRTASWGGRTITLKYFYNGGCGSFARIENAPSDCWVILDRTPVHSTASWSWVEETVDPGDNFAYTKMGNNLNGRYSRGALACGPGSVLARTDWY
jgi:hypothetical protein